MRTQLVHRQTFSKNNRLLSSEAFQQVFDKASYRVSCRQFLILAKPNTRSNARLGLVIGKKNIRLAVSRNRIKRLVRESFRCCETELPPTDIVFLARRGLDQPELNVPSLLAEAWAKLDQEAQQA